MRDSVSLIDSRSQSLARSPGWVADWFDALRLLVAIKEESIAVRIPIFNRTAQVVGRLVPMTARHLDDQNLIETFVRWRNQNRTGYLDQRPVTEAGTRCWMQDVVTNPTRLTFLVYLGERLIGRNGLVKLTPDGHEADGLVRGERGGGMEFSFASQVAGLAFLFRMLKSPGVVARILSDNVLAFENCRSLGYDLKPVSERDVFGKSYPQGTVIEDFGDSAERIQGLKLLTIRLSREAFFDRMKERAMFLPDEDYQYLAR